MAQLVTGHDMPLTVRDDSDEEDDAAALMAELAKIKREREEEKARQVGVSSYSV